MNYTKLIPRFMIYLTVLALTSQTVLAAGDTNVYRMYNPNNGDHFLTTNYEERVINSCPNPSTYFYENDSFNAYPSKMGNNSAVYRVYSPGNQHHFYTIDSTERDKAILAGYNQEKIAFYADASQQTGDIPVYRLYSAVRSDHFYTTDANLKNAILNDPNSAIPYTDEGIAFWVNNAAPLTIYRMLDFGPVGHGFDRYDHFYTTADERDAIRCTGPTYRYEGIVFSVFGSNPGGLYTAVKRIYRRDGLGHFYTTSDAEYNSLSLADYNHEGVVFYVSPSAANIIYRFINLKSGYMYVLNGAEKNYLIGQSPVWNLETEAFNADLPCISSCTNPTN